MLRGISRDAKSMWSEEISLINEKVRIAAFVCFLRLEEIFIDLDLGANLHFSPSLFELDLQEGRKKKVINFVTLFSFNWFIFVKSEHTLNQPHYDRAWLQKNLIALAPGKFYDKSCNIEMIGLRAWAIGLY